MSEIRDPVQARVEDVHRPSLKAASAFVLLAVAGLWITAALAWLFPAMRGGQMARTNAAYYLPFMLLPILLYARGRSGFGSALRLNPMSGRAIFVAALAAMLSVYAANGLALVWEAMLARLGLTSGAALAVPQNRQALMTAMLTMAALPAVCEELLFRGLVLSAWESRGTRLAVAVSAGLFALLHGNLFGWPAYLLVGWVSARLVTGLDCLYAGITYHTLYNALLLALAYALRGSDGVAAAPTSAESLAALAVALPALAMLGALLWSVERRAGAEGIFPIPRIRRPLNRPEQLWLLAALAAMLVTTAVLLVGAQIPAR